MNMHLRSIIDATADVMKIKPDEIKGRSRSVNIVKARHVAMFVASSSGKHSFGSIGKAFGHIDHSSVWHGARKIANAVMVNSALAAEVEAVRERTAERYEAARKALQGQEAALAAYPAPQRETPASGQMRASAAPSKVKPPTAIRLASADLARFEVGSRIWCEVQNCRFALAMGRPDYTPTVEAAHVV